MRPPLFFVATDGGAAHHGGMPLPNRVSPFGELFADPALGLFMGNRGGRIHNDARTLTLRRWTSRAWICCLLEFKGRHRNVWQDGYTEMFFLDEPTALAAGHRPCFECRRRDALAFANAWQRAQRAAARPRAAEMDVVLHEERLTPAGERRAALNSCAPEAVGGGHFQASRGKRRHVLPIAGLPDGAFIAVDDRAFAVRGRSLLCWAPDGYAARRPRPPSGDAEVLTPPATLAVLRAGYQPRWHDSAG